MYWNLVVTVVKLNVFISWTLTFDVLKLSTNANVPKSCMLNINIWCIEISILERWSSNKHRWTLTFDVLKFQFCNTFPSCLICWTLTFDVLKYKIFPYFLIYEHRWTLTFDVLKFLFPPQTLSLANGWTLTFDVLKFLTTSFF